jgi:long-chain fatty acid transport protein
MTRLSGWLLGGLAAGGLAVSSLASATTGYFALGYGAKAMGVAGAVASNPQDSATIAVNPAGITAIGERVDVGLEFFSPQRKGELDTSALGATFDVKEDSRRNLFLVPNFGFNMKLSDNLWFGFNNYGNGGMNSTYDRNLYDESSAVLGAYAFGIPSPPAPAPIPPGPGAAAAVPEGTTTGTPDTGKLGIDLVQAIYAPALALRFHEKQSIGVSLLIGVQRFSARGLGNFQCFTKSVKGAPPCPFGAAVPTDKLTNNESDWAYGAGVRVGYMAEVHPRLTLGASASSKIYMTHFKDYSELFAESGDLDIPANYTLSATFKATPKLKLSFDFERILYEGVNSISNPGPVATPAGPGLPPGGDWLGTKNGLGFGWQDINIYRLAAEYNYDDHWIFRTGFAYNDQPIPNDQVLFNILAPATIQKHATVGFTYQPDKKSEWNFAYMHAFKETVESSQTAFGIPGSISMYQNEVDVSYSYKF